MRPSRADIDALDVETRLDLIEELWDSIAGDPGAAGQLPLTAADGMLLDALLQEHRDGPWAEIALAVRALGARLVLRVARARRVDVEPARLRVLEEAVDDARPQRVGGVHIALVQSGTTTPNTPP